MNTSDWRNRAVCRSENSELFFPIGNTGPALLQIEEAKAVCRRCPVMADCLEWAIEKRQDDGVWGGLSEDERRAHPARRNKRKTAPPGSTQLALNGLELEAHGLTRRQAADRLNVKKNCLQKAIDRHRRLLKKQQELALLEKQQELAA